MNAKSRNAPRRLTRIGTVAAPPGTSLLATTRMGRDSAAPSSTGAARRRAEPGCHTASSRRERRVPSGPVAKCALGSSNATYKWRTSFAGRALGLDDERPEPSGAREMRVIALISGADASHPFSQWVRDTQRHAKSPSGAGAAGVAPCPSPPLGCGGSKSSGSQYTQYSAAWSMPPLARRSS